eukprot:107812_1
MSVSYEEHTFIATNRNAICHIDFAFQLPCYYDALTSHTLLIAAIANTMTDILSKANSLQLQPSDVQIDELDLRPNDINPQRIKIHGWFKCQDIHRKTYMKTLNYIQQTRKLSKA